MELVNSDIIIEYYDTLKEMSSEFKISISDIINITVDNYIITLNKKSFKISDIKTINLKNITKIDSENAIHFFKNGEIHSIYDTAIIDKEDKTGKYYFINGVYYHSNYKKFYKEAVKLRRKEN
jgi:hypothetical protein